MSGAGGPPGPSSQTPRCAEGSAVPEAGEPVAVKAEPSPEPRKVGWPSRLSEQAAPWPAHQRDRAVGPSDPEAGGRSQQPLPPLPGLPHALPALPSSPLHVTAWTLRGRKVGPGRWGRSDGEHLHTNSLGHRVGSSAPPQGVGRSGPALLGPGASLLLLG